MTHPYAFAFGTFKLSFPQRSLSRDGTEIKLGSRALDILEALAEAVGELVSNQALVARVWPNTVVDEGSLRVHISALRKALNDGHDGTRLIVNEAGRGYRIAVNVQKEVLAPHVDQKLTLTGARSTLPISMSRIVGRDAVMDALSASLLERRLMTVTGSGGIGKTTVALGIARRFEAANSAKAFFVDFAPVTNPSRASSTIASAMGVPITTDDPIPDLIDAIGNESVLMVLDNCEHLVETITILVERMLRGASGLRLLVTSSEPLRAEGEWVHRLASLASPDDSSAVSVPEATSFPAVALFVERAIAAHDGFRLSEENVGAVCDICQHLDGIPLAIEMAAARIASMDVRSLASRLVDRFAILTRGRRNALPRQQTLRAMLDWSYALLEPNTQTVLNRLALYRSTFKIDAAIAVAICPDIDDLMVINAIADLVAKSLLVSDSESESTEFRLAESTRHYALEKLANGDAENRVQLRHATYVCSLFGDPGPAWAGNAKRELTVRNKASIDDVRTSFDWAVSANGDPALAVKIAVLTSPLWFQLSLPYEYMRLAERGINAVERAGLAGSIDHVQLLIAYGHAIWHACGPIQKMADAFEEALLNARKLDLPEFEMRCLCGLLSQKLQSGQYSQSLEITRSYEHLCEASPQLATTQTAKRMLALSLERLGQFDEALRLIEEVIDADSATALRVGHANAAQMDGRIAAWTLKMRLLWLLGRGADALKLARMAVDESLVVRHDLSICFCLTMGVLPVALWCGNKPFGVEVLAILRGRTKKNGLRFWDTWADGFDAILHGLSCDASSATLYQLEIFATLGDVPSMAAMRCAKRSEAAIWCRAELLRREAISTCVAVAANTEDLLGAALLVATTQRAHAWALRIVTTLASLKQKHGEIGAAMSSLMGARTLFAENDNTLDVREADDMLRQLARM